MSEISNAELDAAVHERVMGKCWHEIKLITQRLESSGGIRFWQCGKCKSTGFNGLYKNPSYSTDLNVCREAEMKLRDGHLVFDRYVNELISIVAPDRHRLVKPILFATARDRCIAMLEAVK